ncbi:MAG: nucleoside kinase [Alistipes sp.]|nr:nucleoside kinase [Alistipes sp.]
MDNRIRVYCENTASYIDVAMGTSLLGLLAELEIENSEKYLAAYVNNRLKELNYRVYTPISIRFIDITHFEGHRVYQRTVTFILQAAMAQLYPDNQFHIRHSLGSGVYCEAAGKELFSSEECREIEAAARAIVAENITIQRRKEPTVDIVEKFKKAGYPDKAKLLSSRPRLYNNIYYMGQNIGYFFGPLAPSSGYADRFDIYPYKEGFVVAMPDRVNPAKMGRIPKAEKMGGLFHQFHEWMDIVGVPTVGELNSRILQGDTSELIKIAEAVHSRQFSNIADKIYQAHDERGVKVVLISGPSSSGKTTSAKRIGIQLRVLGLQPVLISLDDYFVNREDTPKDENGDYDYEALEALDLVPLNDDLCRLIAGESVEIPRYDFITGTRKWHEHPLQLTERSILIMEGIHGLNPKLTPALPDDIKFKIYLSCFTSVAMDNITRIHTTDNRLLRRITRDYRTRGNNGYDTIARWQSVRRGEDKHIFPYQENADVMVNTSLFYELGVLRPIVEPILREIPDTVPEYGEASRLLHFLDNFVPVPTDEIPLDSVLREFVGGSSFKY